MITSCLNNVIVKDRIPSPIPSNTPENTIGIAENIKPVLIIFNAGIPNAISSLSALNIFNI